MRCPCGSNLSVGNCDKHEEPTPTIEADKLKAGTMQRPITVGTQVRLTGVVVKAWPEGGFEVCVDGAPDLRVNIRAKHLEVIRQPFKRGEVVWATYDPKMAYQVLKDEKDGVVLIIRDAEIGGNTSFEGNSIDFERRP